MPQPKTVEPYEAIQPFVGGSGTKDDRILNALEYIAKALEHQTQIMHMDRNERKWAEKK